MSTTGIYRPYLFTRGGRQLSPQVRGALVSFYSETDLSALSKPPVPVWLPSWLFGGDLTGFPAFVGWDLHWSDGAHSVRNEESRTLSAPGLIHVARLGSSIDPKNVAGFDRLRQILTEHDEFSQSGSWDRAVKVFQHLQDEFGDELVGHLAGFRALFIGTEKAEDLPMLVSEALSALTRGDSVLKEASTHLVWTEKTLGRRYGVVRALLNAGADRPMNAEHLSESSRELVQDVVIGLSSYLEPLVTSLSPYVWGATATRAGGVVIISFGKAFSGRRELNSDLLSLSARISRTPALPIPDDMSPKMFRDAITWWVNRLDLLFSHLTEPANNNVAGEFHPAAALERLMTFEQICRSVQSIATTEDPHLRRLALFHVLDSMAGLNSGLKREVVTKFGSAEALLAKLRHSVPREIQPVLLPRAEAAVEALRQVQDGFFDKSRIKDGQLQRTDSSGAETYVPLATAASEWLRVLRNSQHGYEQTPTPQDRSLLAAHDGTVPARLPDLAWLVLLNFLAHPEVVDRKPRPERPTRRKGR
jgi:hypothetical protein